MEELVVIAICLFLNALLAAYEMAFVSVPKPELRRLAKSGVRNAARLLSLREAPERTLSIIQVGITLVGAVSSAVGGAAAAESLEPYFIQRLGIGTGTAEVVAIIVVVLPITYLSVVIGELVPKSLALRNPVRITLAGARWLFFADRLLSPAVTALEWSTQRILLFKFLRLKKDAEPAQTAVEIDTLPQHHQQAILNLAYIERKKVQDVLMPWKDVVSVKITDTMDDVVPIVFASGHTRLPVIDGDSTVGVLHTKEFLALRETGAKDWKPLIRSVIVVQPNDSILLTLRVLQKNRSHMAVVVGPNAVCLGLVTMEDISEEIWGEIYDEDDDGRIHKIFAERVKSRRGGIR